MRDRASDLRQERGPATQRFDPTGAGKVGGLGGARRTIFPVFTAFLMTTSGNAAATLTSRGTRDCVDLKG